MVAHRGAFANRPLRNYTRKYMLKFWKIEKRRRAIVMRENMARRTLIRANPQYGPFRPVDIHECSSDSDDEPTNQWLLQQVMFQLLFLDCLHSQLPELIELWISSMHQALLGKGFSPTSTPGTLVLEIWRNYVLNFGRNSDLMEQQLSMICTSKTWQMKRPQVLNKTLMDPHCQGGDPNCRHTQNHSVRSGSPTSYTA